MSSNPLVDGNAGVPLDETLQRDRVERFKQGVETLRAEFGIVMAPIIEYGNDGIRPNILITTVEEWQRQHQQPSSQG